MKLKYLINHYIDLQPRSVGIEQIVSVLEKEHDISRSTFLRDRGIKLDQDASIPTDRLEVYASLLGVSTDELKNYPAKKIKPLAERRPSAVMQKVIKRAKLKR
jgi:hypothetical protein